MFGGSLLESSSRPRGRKRWPMAAAFTLEAFAAAVLVLIPLVTTGVIPVSAHVIACPLGSVHIAKPTAQQNQGGPLNQLRYSVVTLADNRHHAITGTPSSNNTSELSDGQPDFRGIGIPNGVPNLPFGSGRPTPVSTPTPRHLIVSNISEGQLIVKVEPVYPRLALLTHQHGDVKLHAFIAKDGTIQSLSVSSGHPLLAQAALDAVRQWRYRPYYLNGEPVEVETFITVSFKGIRD
ncbi:MAG TPA: energy transducer TonB [Candidatus Angelobacter sp.]|nr:energy transducer TonB [Candidatus Angelobacter sp.]